MGQTARRLKSEVAVAYDEFTSDILENRLLKAAIERIRRSSHAPASRFGKRKLAFDQAKGTWVEPDLAWVANGKIAFVGDAKYKRIDDNMCNPDLYQMLAYVVAANLPSGMLIYPKGEANRNR